MLVQNWASVNIEPTLGERFVFAGGGGMDHSVQSTRDDGPALYPPSANLCYIGPTSNKLVCIK